ncbi:MAG: L,D-transpeptidase [Polyangiaceae bacterium]
MWLCRAAWVLCLSLGCARAKTDDQPALMRVSPGAEPSPSQSAAPAAPLAPRVSLAGAARARRSSSAATRLHARVPRAWIYAEPRTSAERLGYVRAGASVSSRGSAGRGEGCAEGFVALEPRGFACQSSFTADAEDALVQATRGGPTFENKLPYLYGTVRKPGPVYGRLPTRDEMAASEPEFEARMQAWLRAGGEVGASYGQQLWLSAGQQLLDPVTAWNERRTLDIPGFLSADRALPRFEQRGRSTALVAGQMRPRAGYSFLRTFWWEGRRFGLTTDLTLAPTDRFRPIQGSDFHGVEIGKDIELPFAFVRNPEAHVFRLEKNALVDAGPAAYRSVHKLTGKQQFFKNRLHFETSEGNWLSDAHASRIDAAKKMPGWGKNGEHWLDVNLSKQTLVAYDGTRPVYATLISSGEAGLEDHEHSTATKRGIFRIHTKHVTTSMSSDEAGEEFELRDVPYVQYFEDGYALHGAYWHDRFGTPKSHGCINLAPEDARRLFSFTEPQLPEDWHGVLMPLRGSVVFVHP